MPPLPISKGPLSMSTTPPSFSPTGEKRWHETGVELLYPGRGVHQHTISSWPLAATIGEIKILPLTGTVFETVDPSTNTTVVGSSGTGSAPKTSDCCASTIQRAPVQRMRRLVKKTL